MTTTFSSSTWVEATPAAAYDALCAAPLEVLFSTRSGPIPAVARCDGQVGEWGAAGQTRTVVLADGTGNLETLVVADRDTQQYRYLLSEFRGPFRLLIATIDGRFAFEPEGTGTRVTWSWALHPKNPVAGLALPVIGVFWRRWATAMWPRYAAML